MNAYLEANLAKARSVESSRVNTLLSPPHFAELGAVPKTPLQQALRVNHESAVPLPTAMTAQATCTATRQQD